MKSLYIILSVLGWIWTFVFFATWWFKARRRKAEDSRKGFGVIPHE